MDLYTFTKYQRPTARHGNRMSLSAVEVAFTMDSDFCNQRFLIFLFLF